MPSFSTATSSHIAQGDEQEVQGRPGVADGPQGGGQIVIGEGEDHPGQNNPEVGGDVRHQGLRRLNQPEDLGQEELTQQNRGQGAAADEDSGDVQLPPQAWEIFLPVELSDQDPGPHAGPGYDVDIQIHNALRHAEGGKGAVPNVVDDHLGVHDVVELLQHVGAQYGQAQLDQLGRNAA